MTLTARNGLLLGATILSAALLSAPAITVLSLGSLDPTVVVDSASETMQWLLWSWQPPPAIASLTLAAAFGAGIISFAGSLLFRRLFRRVASPAVFFVALFVLSLSLEQLRFVQYWLVSTGGSLNLGAFVSRVLRFGNLFGSLSLFTASLYAAGVDYSRTGTVALTLALLSFVIVYFMPVDALELMPVLVHRVGVGQSLDILLAALSLLTIANFVYAAATSTRDDRVYLAAAIVAVVIGRTILAYPPGLAMVGLGGLLLVGGLTAYAWLNRLHYLWY